MSEEEVKLRFGQQGAEALLAMLRSMKEGASGLVDSFKGLFSTFESGAAAAGGLGGSLGVLSTMLGAAISPIGLAAIAFGALFVALEKTAAAAEEVFERVRTLEATSGMSARGADIMSKQFELAGVSSGALQMGLFRLSAQVESGGKALEQYGISIRDATGALKEPGPLLEEVISKLRGMADATERNAILRELFGRQGRAFATAIGLTAEQWDAYKKSAEEASVVDKAFMEQTREYVKRTAELGHEWEKVKLAIATTIALPVMGWFVTGTKYAIEFASAVGGLFKAFFTGKPMFPAIKALFGGGKEDAHAAAVAEEKPAGEGGTKRLTEAEVKRNEEEYRTDAEHKRRMLQSDATYAAEKSKIQSGSDAAGIQAKMAANEEEIRLARELYDKLIAEELKAHPNVDRETEIKFRKQRDDTILKMEEENRKALLDLDKAKAADAKRVMDDEVRALKINSDSRLAVLKERQDGELAINKLMNQSKVSEAIEQNSIEERYARANYEVKETQLKREERAMRDLASQYPNNFAIQHEVQQKLQEIEKERVSNEMSANSQIIQSRTAMVQKMKQLADEEAGIGDSLQTKAIERLKKRGRTRASEGDIESEINKMRGEGASTMGDYRSGGRVGLDKLSDAMGNAGVFRQLNRMGSTVSGAVGTSVRAGAAAFGGGDEPSMPSNAAMLPGGKMTEVNPQLGTDKIVGAYQKAFSEATTAVDAAIKTIASKIDAGNSIIADKLFDRFMDQMVRRLEIEASRT